MAPVKLATIKFSPTKSCFLYVPESFAKEKMTVNEFPILKLKSSEHTVASYFSCKLLPISNSPSESLVHLNASYANLLSLREKDPVLVEFVESSLVKVEKVFLEPLKTEDWEIMHMNSELIESSLLNQIRVVWKDQRFPIWANQATISVKVSQVIPDAEPCLLEEWTEIYIAPKEHKNVSSTKKQPSKSKVKQHLYNQYKHLRKQHCTLQKSQEVSSMSAVGDRPNPNSAENSPVSLLQYFVRSFLVESVPQNFPLHAEQQYMKFHPINFDVKLRAISCSQQGNFSNLPLAIQSTTVFISDKTFSSCFDKYSVPSCFVAKLAKMFPDINQGPSKSKSDKLKLDQKSLNEKMFQELIVNIVVLKHIGDDEFNVPEALFQLTDVVAIPTEIMRELGIDVSCSICLQGVNPSPYVFDTIILHSFEKLHANFSDNLLSSSFVKWVEDAHLEDSSIVLCNGTCSKLLVGQGKFQDFLIELSHSSSFGSVSTYPVTLNASSDSKKDSEAVEPFKHLIYGFLDLPKLHKIKIQSAAYSPSLRHLYAAHNRLQDVQVQCSTIENIGGVTDLYEKTIQIIQACLKWRPVSVLSNVYFPYSSCILIHGVKGVGKTTLVTSMCKELVNHPYFIHVSFIKCLPLRGKRVDTIAKKWESIILESVSREPSLLIFEDLDQLASSNATVEQGGQDGTYFSDITQVFINYLEQIRMNSWNIVIVATASSLQKLHSDLIKPQGQNIFQRIYEFQQPTMPQRIEILKSLILSKTHNLCHSLNLNDLTDIAGKTEGYVAQDLEALVHHATYVSWMRSRNNISPQCNQSFESSRSRISLTKDDFEDSILDTSPISLKVSQPIPPNFINSWEQIGGLHEVKKAVQQTLLWPLKYKSLFQHYTLKPQRNILLYGAPGTGKTVIASVIANECGMNFISIKGPELLSKYIGASEQGVRDLFIRAKTAKPCILFFDEFDALAPRRGHDSTGVTDRVVNQLLTQMDGIESMEGVHVFAATNRPELIDPALLRPGRFDKCLYCPLPNQSDRFEILNALSSKLSLADDVDFKIIIDKTEHFSGADLHALLYSSQIAALHDCKGNFSTESKNNFSSDHDENILRMATIESGYSDLLSENTEKIVKEIDVTMSNFSNFDNTQENSKPKQRNVLSLVIHQRHLLEVLSGMKPSVSNQERMRYQKIFKKVDSSGAQDFATLSLVRSEKKVTLA